MVALCRCQVKYIAVWMIFTGINYIYDIFEGFVEVALCRCQVIYMAFWMTFIEYIHIFNIFEGFVEVALCRCQVRYGNGTISQPTLASRENISPPRYLAKAKAIFVNILI